MSNTFANAVATPTSFLLGVQSRILRVNVGGAEADSWRVNRGVPHVDRCLRHQVHKVALGEVLDRVVDPLDALVKPLVKSLHERLHRDGVLQRFGGNAGEHLWHVVLSTARLPND